MKTFYRIRWGLLKSLFKSKPVRDQDPLVREFKETDMLKVVDYVRELRKDPNNCNIEVTKSVEEIVIIPQEVPR